MPLTLKHFPLLKSFQCNKHFHRKIIKNLRLNGEHGLSRLQDQQFYLEDETTTDRKASKCVEKLLQDKLDKFCFVISYHMPRGVSCSYKNRAKVRMKRKLFDLWHLIYSFNCPSLKNECHKYPSLKFDCFYALSLFLTWSGTLSSKSWWLVARAVAKTPVLLPNSTVGP